MYISAYNEIESEDEEVILYTTNNRDNDFYPTDSSEDEEKEVNTYNRTGRRQGN